MVVAQLAVARRKLRAVVQSNIDLDGDLTRRSRTMNAESENSNVEVPVTDIYAWFEMPKENIAMEVIP